MELTLNSAQVATTQKTISKSELTTMINNGSKKEDIAKHYGLNNNQTTNLLKSTGLKIKKTQKPAFILVD